MFSESSTRATLWDGFERYLARFAELESRYEALLDGRRIVEFVWLGGSFVSTRLHPRNIDLTVAINSDAPSKLFEKPGSAWMSRAFDRLKCQNEFGVAPIQLNYRRVKSVFQSWELPSEDVAYLRERGAWDDWWQRCRLDGETGPSTESAEAKRGYLEVTL
ncbi:DUF6932 family protein [Kribbella lupini]